METAARVINHIKDGYLWLANRVSAHPHVTIVAFVAQAYLVWRFL